MATQRPTHCILLLVALSLCVSIAPRAMAATIGSVVVGNPGNPPDQNYAGQGQFGAVPYGYRIAIHEVTNAEYAGFLIGRVSISYDPSSPFFPPTFGNSRSLLNESMLYDSRGGLTVHLPTGCMFNCGFGKPTPQPAPRFGVRTNMGDKPVNYVSYYDALRFANWLHNGRGSGDTETGAYTLGPLGASGVPLNPAAITRNPDATVFLPNENEWYKAAYYQPADENGDSDGYWLNPTGCNCGAASLATANSLGDINNPGAHVINEAGAGWNTLTDNSTTVGSAGPLSASFYGTFDQGGNVHEWTETAAASGRVVRGGSWEPSNNLGFRADQRSILSPVFESADLGFRVAYLIPVPEPATVPLAVVGLGLLIKRSRSRFRFVRPL